MTEQPHAELSWWRANSTRVAGLALVLLALFAQSYEGRVNLVSELRSDCERAAIRNAADANRTRAQATGDAATAVSVGVPAGVSRVRRQQARAELSAVAVDDSQVDQGRWYLMTDSRDQHAVRYGQWVREWRSQFYAPSERVGRMVYLRPFRCDTAYPSASPIELFR